GNGDGTFSQSSAYYIASTTDSWAPTYAYVLGVRDFDGDGRSDVLTTWDAVRLLTGNGDGTLQTPPSYFSGAWTTPDVNADGKLDHVDLVYDSLYSGGSSTTRYAYVRLGYGDGSFAPPVFTDLGIGYKDRSV